jgi:hypothetical protein
VLAQRGGERLVQPAEDEDGRGSGFHGLYLRTLVYSFAC